MHSFHAPFQLAFGNAFPVVRRHRGKMNLEFLTSNFQMGPLLKPRAKPIAPLTPRSSFGGPEIACDSSPSDSIKNELEPSMNDVFTGRRELKKLSMR